ncbi:MAG: HlyD family efflux transporter periplasmic adaptor subunit [Alphaproteobacteria bacterium]|nr:HlyD family efflux transporter periplasmic adaptor subunit [Alphaproteobacteria bacterium]
MIAWQRLLWPAAIGIVLILALAYAYWPRPIPVDIVKVTKGEMLVAVEDDGVTRVKEAYVISAPIAGRVLRIETHVGDDIEAGKTVIAQMLPADPVLWDARTRRELEFTASAARAARDLAAAAITASVARATEARQELARTRQLFAKGHVAQARLDRAETQLQTADADVATAQAALRQREFDVKTAEAALMAPTAFARQPAAKRYYDVRSAVSGKVLRLIHENEAVVQPGQPLVEIGNPANLEVVVDLLSTDAVKANVGDAVQIKRWGGDGYLNGRVRRIEPSGALKISSLGIEEQRVKVLVDITDPPERWSRLGHGYQVDAAIVLWRASEAVQVPIGALFRDGAKWAVFRLRDGRATLQDVEIGHINDTAAEVLRGLDAGDIIVTHPSDRVQAGVLVVARE